MRRPASYGARYYEPTTSRWISPDPAGFELINPMDEDGEPLADGWPEGFGPGQSGGMRKGYSVIESLNWYAYVSNNPVKYVDPTGMEKEKFEQLGRIVAIAASAAEVVVGALLIPGGVTTPIGAVMVAHGGANLAAATASTIAYETTDGNTELSTSTLGLAAQGLSYWNLRNQDVSKAVAKDRAAMVGSVADVVDGAMGFAINPSSAVAKIAAKASSVANLAGDVGLAGATAQDWSSNASAREATERKKEIQAIEAKGL